MHRHRRYLLAALLAGVAAPALAQSLGMGLGLDSVDRPGAGAPLDIFTTPAAAYSFRKLKSTYAGPAIRLRRASDNAEQDINFLGFTGFTGAPIDTAAANAHCASTSCFIKTIYDQSGNARHATQATSALQPQYIASCVNGLPCARSAGTQILPGPSVTPATGLASFAGVEVVNTAGATCRSSGYGAMVMALTHADRWILWNGGGVFSNTVTPIGGWRTGAGVYNAASSVINIDGADSAPQAVGQVTTPGVIGVWAAGDDGIATCSHVEAVFWDNYVLSAAERAAVTANQRSFWGL